MLFPKVVGLDTEYTIWQGLLSHPKQWGRGKGASTSQEDNIQRVDRWVLKDKTNKSHWIRFYSDVSAIITDILRNGAKLAIVSRNPNKIMVDRALYYFNALNPKDGKEWSIVDLAEYDEVRNESKTNHWRKIQGYCGTDYSDMLMFDHAGINNVVRVELGVSFQLAVNQKGLTWDTYRRGLKAWQGAKALTLPSKPGSMPQRMLIGYSGLPPYWIDLTRKGVGLVDPSTPYRWGYALYVTSFLAIAKYCQEWNNKFNKEKSFVCEVWVKDYDAWVNANKIWVPEHHGKLPQMNSMHASAEASGKNQEDRDRFIGDHWGVPMPYVLFSQHHWFKGMPPPRQRRWAEMVVYTQIYRTLFEVVPLSNADVNKITDPEPFPFGKQFKTWRITAPAETRKEFWRYKEKELHSLSA